MFKRNEALGTRILRGGERGEECSPVLTDRNGYHFAEVKRITGITKATKRDKKREARQSEARILSLQYDWKLLNETFVWRVYGR